MGINLVLNGYEWIPMATIICSCMVYIWRWRYFWRLCDDLLTWNPLIYFLTSRHEVVNPDDMAMCLLPSGKLTWLWKMAHLWLIYLIKMVIFHSHVSLPEGNPDDMAMFFFSKVEHWNGIDMILGFPHKARLWHRKNLWAVMAKLPIEAILLLSSWMALVPWKIAYL